MDTPRKALLSLARLALRLSSYLEALAFLGNDQGRFLAPSYRRGTTNTSPQGARRSFFASIWRRVPITIITVGILGSGWAYLHFSDTRARGAGANASLQVTSPIAFNGTRETAPGKTHSVRARAPLSAFRRLPVAPNEVDYIAEDVTIRIFTPKSHSLRSRTRQVDIGNDVTVRYSLDKLPLAESVRSRLPISK